MELFLTLKLYLRKTELFNIELFWHSPKAHSAPEW